MTLDSLSSSELYARAMELAGLVAADTTDLAKEAELDALLLELSCREAEGLLASI